MSAGIGPAGGLAQAVSRDRVLIGPEAAALVLSLIGGAERLARRDGIGLSPQLTRLRDELRIVAMAANGHADVRTRPTLAPSDEWVTSGQASRLLGCSPRQTRRLAASGSLGVSRRVGQSWLVSRAEVAAYAAQREEHA